MHGLGNSFSLHTHEREGLISLINNYIQSKFIFNSD